MVGGKMINNILNEVGNALDDKDAEIARLRQDLDDLGIGCRKLRAENAELEAALAAAIEAMETRYDLREACKAARAALARGEK